MKILFLILDGLGDRPIKELANKTPLEAAKTPNLDFLAAQGTVGLVETAYKKKFPSSLEGHLSLFGYDINKWNTNRGVFEAVGVGMRLKKTDVALRGNFATVEPAPSHRGSAAVGGSFKIIDRRAGRIKDTSQLVRAISGIKIKGVEFLVKDSLGHRLALVLRGKGLSDKISDGDLHQVNIKAPKILPRPPARSAGGRERANLTAQVLNEFLLKAHQILEHYPLNKQRLKKGLAPANYILVREAGRPENIPSFQKKWGLRACCIAGGKLYQGIGKVLKMDLIKVKGATGEADTNIEGKFKAARRALKKYDFCFCHIKATDNFSHDGDFQGKMKFIEKIDNALSIVMPGEARNLVASVGASGSCGRRRRPQDDNSEVLLVITADHTTPCKVKQHTGDPMPVLVYLPKFCKAKLGQVKKFSERECQKGALGYPNFCKAKTWAPKAKIKSTQLLHLLLKFAKIKYNKGQK